MISKNQRTSKDKDRRGRNAENWKRKVFFFPAHGVCVCGWERQGDVMQGLVGRECKGTLNGRQKMLGGGDPVDVEGGLDCRTG